MTSLQLEMASKVERQGWSSVVDSWLGYKTGQTSVKSRPLVIALVRAVTLAQPWDVSALGIRAGAQLCLTDEGKYEDLPKNIEVLIVGGDEDSPEQLWRRCQGGLPGRNSWCWRMLASKCRQCMSLNNISCLLVSQHASNRDTRRMCAGHRGIPEAAVDGHLHRPAVP